MLRFAWALLVPALVELYSKAPGSWAASPPLLPDELGATQLTLLFPGFGGIDANTERIIENSSSSSSSCGGGGGGGGGSKAYCYDWANYRGNLFRAANNGAKVGAAIGKQLANDPSFSQLADLHVVGISVGSFAADACVTAYAREAKKKTAATAAAAVVVSKSGTTEAERDVAATRLTLLDPFTQRGVLRPGWGVRHFGASADFAEQWLNTDDPVPSTNTPLRHAHCFDVTGAAAREAFEPLPGDNMHSWPAAFFGQLQNGQGIQSFVPLYQPQRQKLCHKTFPRGAITTVR